MRVKNIIYVKQNHIWNPSKCSCENGKYLASIMNDSAIVWWSYKVIRQKSENKFQQVPTNFNKKEIHKIVKLAKKEISVFYLHFLKLL